MEVKNSNSGLVPVEKSAISSKKNNEIIVTDLDPVILDLKDYLKIEPINQGKVDPFKFIDTISSSSTFQIEPITLKDQKKKEIFKTSYDEKSKVTTIESDENNLQTKTIINQNSKNLTTEITKKSENNQLKLTGDFNAEGSKLKNLGIESSSKDTNLKANFDPKKENLTGEVKQNVGNQKVRINSDFDLKKSNVNNISIESSDQDSLVKANLNTKTNSLATELNQKIGDNKYKLSGDYNFNSSSINKLGVEYSNKDLKINTDYSLTPKNEEVKLNLNNNGFEINNRFDLKNSFSIKSTEVSKPFVFGSNLPTVKLSAGYDYQKNTFNKIGLDLTSNFNNKISLTYSTNLAELSQKHSMKLNYNLHSTTRLSLEGNFDGIRPENSGARLSITSSFKF